MTMTEVAVRHMPAFKKIYKKFHTQHKEAVDDAIRAIIKDPKIGEEKKGDLAGVFVYKFKIQQQEILLAYEWDPEQGILLALGSMKIFIVI